ncbi:cytochrome o ubiquinol oxidase subunit III [Cupriavidus plantarum]|uniref:Cytochrome bo(3) ubiquinol oxidase subunit 3 n=1 Tax=Cupriavidus plantarum TaxID=942865 RepID=A0A316EZB1_9BURK|nr:cytochrome o ubiquinol oxidase subunit III [Cupriavidus plantarum]PWK37711.1 cytochrome bo3 quinol oxidase subunit 3 [Cupriavidus plantarum]RLK45558.1 cytochrome bo3 quinol oxidase subunit 3 [Cupriavidus plantarum]CAG2128089.1 Cytochrome bo(3) ubiquinol oxidase subunit 3 [Cupriavidus plantarum]SMR66731.1 cytochrome bo3 quinol oxidase subunit 3 [Cupriavidus plantarum]
MSQVLSVTAHGHADGHGDHDAHAHDSHDSGTTLTLGFWLYLMSDCLIFATLFATFGVLVNNTAGGPSGQQLFELPFVLGETMLLLLSSFTFGVAMLNLYAGRTQRTIVWLAITFLFGAGFIAMEIHEFAELIHRGAGPNVSASLSAYYALVGTHGLHVSAGLLWLLVMMHQLKTYGLDAVTRRRMACLSLFWHFLDLIWICVFTFVYLREFV